MIQLKAIQEALEHLVGWRQDYDPKNHISEELTETESGLYFQGAHPLLTLENIRANMPDTFTMQFPEWREDVPYRPGDIVSVKQEATSPEPFALFRALRDNENVVPVVGGDWEQFSPLSAYLKELTYDAICDMTRNFIQHGVVSETTKNLLERKVFYDGTGLMSDTIQNTGNIVGYEITTKRNLGVTMQIEEIGLQTFGTPGTVKIYVFHSNRMEPWREIDVQVKGSGTFEWVKVKDLYLPYLGNDKGAGGSWFVVYNQSDLVNLKAINMMRDYSLQPGSQPCCGQIASLQTWRQLTDFMEFNPFKVGSPSEWSDNPQLWDIRGNIFPGNMNWGMNLKVSIGCDLTDLIISQRNIFADLLQLQLANNILLSLAHNPSVRVNRNQFNVTYNEIRYELDGNKMNNYKGLGWLLDRAYEAVNLDTSGLDETCLPCKNGGVRYTVA